MATQKYFYKDSTLNIFFVGTSKDVLPAGNYEMKFHNSNTRVSLVSQDTQWLIMEPTEITNLLKESDAAYTDRADLLLGVQDFF